MADLYAVVQRHLKRRGMSLRALAAAVHYDASYLSKALRGLKPLGPALARDIDQALGAGGEVTAAALRPPPAPPEVPVAPELVDYFKQQLAGHYAADRFLGPGRLIPVAGAQYELLCDTAATAAPALRAELWATAAGFAALLGWLHQDAGDLAESARWHDVMIERAHRSRDPQLVAFALFCKAMLHTDMDDGPGVLDLAGAGLSGGRALIPKVRALLLQQAAHGRALTGRPGTAGECDRLLGDAAGLIGSISDDYPWGACTAPRWIETQQATIWTRLGRHQEAAGLWEQVIPALPSSARRDVGVYHARYARALAGMGEPERAVTVARAAVPVAAQSGSARMAAELRALRGQMEPWRGGQAWRDLEEALRALPRARKAR
jgi:transcriptional regulator with XRE-family HTH domain